ncbi:hypothetical protein GTO89_14725 [Heliobacterium gestii]|uniref:Copper amine oxidase-like N-terminal domain-containing protein n=1 Tax=Heliomicrobium gestii TaxID=2699 RepID=A0A845LN23_HELGE|nr:stalk domain-containing protein [Heliomicrobium gestii]MBM7868020.1 hypothetical protein [Heliomicrobium gestii]MZP44286.1 hypothetical protein [Heliomicrobium gestii]
MAYWIPKGIAESKGFWRLALFPQEGMDDSMHRLFKGNPWTQAIAVTSLGVALTFGSAVTAALASQPEGSTDPIDSTALPQAIKMSDPRATAPATAPTSMSDPDKVLTARFYIGRNYFEVNGKRNGMDSAPLVDEQAGRVLMPLRYLAYSLGIADGDINYTRNASGGVEQVSIRRPAAGGAQDTLLINLGRTDMQVNGGQAGALDAEPRIVNDRLMVPYRAAAQALGGMVAWDGVDKAFTVRTWKTVPAPQRPSAQQVTLLQGQRQMKLMDMGGDEKTSRTPSVSLVVDPVNQKSRFDIMEYLKAWGIPDSAILYDPVRGSLVVRGVAGESKPGEPYGAGFIYFYAGDGYGWISNYQPTNPGDDVDAITLVNGRLYGSVPLLNAVSPLFGRRTEGGMTNDALWVRLVEP